MPEFKPIPDPAGALVPPRRYPPTAVGAATPDPEPRKVPVSAARRRTPNVLERVLRSAHHALLDAKRAAAALRQLVQR